MPNPERVAAERIAHEYVVGVERVEALIREAYAGEAKPQAAEWKHKDGCLWATSLPTGVGTWGCTCGLDHLLFQLEQYPFEAGASPSDDLVKVLTEARDFTETLLTHGDASISIAAKHIWASAERILKTLK